MEPRSVATKPTTTTTVIQIIRIILSFRWTKHFRCPNAASAINHSKGSYLIDLLNFHSDEINLHYQLFQSERTSSVL